MWLDSMNVDEDKGQIHQLLAPEDGSRASRAFLAGRAQPGLQDELR